MSLVAILTPVNTILTTNGALSLTPGTPALELGATPRRDRTSAPRVTWVPGVDQYIKQAPTMKKSEQTAFIAANPGKQIPRWLGTRLAGIEAHIWAGTQPGSVDDYSATETLANAVLSALWHVAYGAVMVNSSGWVNPRGEGTEANRLGHRYVLNLTIAIPVLEVQDNAPGVSEQTTLTTFTPQVDQMGPIPPGGSTFSSTP
jgi:hypothetical protein